jgi:hypothetical protein
LECLSAPLAFVRGQVRMLSSEALANLGFVESGSREFGPLLADLVQVGE